MLSKDMMINLMIQIHDLRALEVKNGMETLQRP